MKIIIYKNDKRNIAINGIDYVNYDLPNNKIYFYWTKHKSYSLGLDEFWGMKVKEEE
jgi:hypothetical protein